MKLRKEGRQIIRIVESVDLSFREIAKNDKVSVSTPSEKLG